MNRQYPLSAVFDGQDWIGTVPIIEIPFRIIAIVFDCYSSGSSLDRQAFVKIRYGGVIDVARAAVKITDNAIGPNTVYVMFAPNLPASNFNPVDSIGQAYGKGYASAGLPINLTLDSQYQIKFGIEKAGAGDSVDNASILIEFDDEQDPTVLG